ncbi:MAG: hypothetical protein H6983_13130 [Ectothiorhodospiraceae bacterium]|nr:hypothetical protein [Ectothiorhodospiraceae bacterium]
MPTDRAPTSAPAVAATTWARLALALLGLNLALTFHNQWPTPWVTTRHELSVELAALVLLLAVVSELRGVPTRRLVPWLAGAFVLLTLARYAEVTAPALFGRRINLFWDGRHFANLTAMLAATVPVWLSAAVVVGALALLAALYLLARLAIVALWDALARPRTRRSCAALGAVVVGGYLVGHLGAGTLGWYALPLSRTYAEQLAFVHDAITGADARADLDRVPLGIADLSALGGADVLVVFVESYGATAFDDPRHVPDREAGQAALARAVDARDLLAVSAFVDSPTFGGASWLAHSTFLTGMEIADNASHALLLTRRRDTLVQRFQAQGYRAVAVMPGLKAAWPEGGFYGFDRIYGERDLDYRGPDFGWWRIPDQFTLARLAATELGAGERAPVLAFFPTVSTHAPFRPVPPYQPDWSRLLGPQPFDVASVRASLEAAPPWADPSPAYAEAVRYALTTLAGFVERHAFTRDGRPLLLVVLGDHQPPASVTGPGVSHEVPVHVITSHRGLAARLVAAGFAAGLAPTGRATTRMGELTELLLAAMANAGPDGGGVDHPERGHRSSASERAGPSAR